MSLPKPWFIRNQLASQAALERYPGLRPRYERLVAAHIAARIAPEQLAPDEAAQEKALRQALRYPGDGRRPAAAAFQKIPPAATGAALADCSEAPEASRQVGRSQRTTAARR
jgi:nitric oxide reductase activation protein